jgi:hypothetical protein
VASLSLGNKYIGAVRLTVTNCDICNCDSSALFISILSIHMVITVECGVIANLDAVGKHGL